MQKKIELIFISVFVLAISLVDYAKAFSSYLLAHGMTQQQLGALVQALTSIP